MELKYSELICCEECNELYGYEIDCPVCKKKNASCDLYYIAQWSNNPEDRDFQCECGAKYRFIAFTPEKTIIVRRLDETK